MSLYTHIPHAHIAIRKENGPVVQAQEKLGINLRIALWVTNAVGTMGCAYFFCILAISGFPTGPKITLHEYVQWLSQTFIQLVMLSLLAVGTNIATRAIAKQSAAADLRSIQTYQDAEATLHEAVQLQEHMTIQDNHLENQDKLMVELIDNQNTIMNHWIDQVKAALEEVKKVETRD